MMLYILHTGNIVLYVFVLLSCLFGCCLKMQIKFPIWDGLFTRHFLPAMVCCSLSDVNVGLPMIPCIFRCLKESLLQFEKKKCSLEPLGHFFECVTFSLPDFGGHQGGLVTTERRLNPPPDQKVRSTDPLGLFSNPGLVGREEPLSPLPNLLHFLPAKISQLLLHLIGQWVLAI